MTWPSGAARGRPSRRSSCCPAAARWAASPTTPARSSTATCPRSPGPSTARQLRPVERVPRSTFAVVNPAPLGERDQPAFVYPSMDAEERESMLEGLNFFTTPHTAEEGLGPAANQVRCMGCHLSGDDNQAPAAHHQLAHHAGGPRHADELPLHRVRPRHRRRPRRGQPGRLTNTGRTAAFTIFGNFSPSAGTFDPLALLRGLRAAHAPVDPGLPARPDPPHRGRSEPARRHRPRHRPLAPRPPPHHRRARRTALHRPRPDGGDPGRGPHPERRPHGQPRQQLLAACVRAAVPGVPGRLHLRPPQREPVQPVLRGRRPRPARRPLRPARGRSHHPAVHHRRHPGRARLHDGVHADRDQRQPQRHHAGLRRPGAGAGDPDHGRDLLPPARPPHRAPRVRGPTAGRAARLRSQRPARRPGGARPAWSAALRHRPRGLREPHDRRPHARRRRWPRPLRHQPGRPRRRLLGLPHPRADDRARRRPRSAAAT